MELLKWRRKDTDVIYEGIAELRWMGSWKTSGCEFTWSGQDEKHDSGVDFLLSSKARTALPEYKPVNFEYYGDKICSKTFSYFSSGSVCTYISLHSERDWWLLQRLKQTLVELPEKDVLLGSGEWNAKIGTDNKGLEKVEERGTGEGVN